MANMGYYTYNEHMTKLYEGINVDKIEDKDGIIIPEENKKAYDWLKKEYTSAKQEVKVEMHVGGAKFEPSYEMQADVESAGKDFKPGMFGNAIPTKKSGTETDFKPNNFSSKSTSTTKKTETKSDSEESSNADNKEKGDETESKEKDETLTTNNSKEAETETKAEPYKKTSVKLHK